MGERRQAARREPIEIELVDGRVFEARPLPWMAAGDLGNEILRQNAEITNSAVRLYMEGDIPQLEAHLAQKITDWQILFKIAFPNEREEKFHTPVDPSIDESASLILASLEVNRLEHLNQLIDPNSPTPTEPGGNGLSEPAGTEDGQKIASIPLSSSEVSPAT